MKRIAALGFAALGCAVAAYALQLQMYTPSGPGAGLFPAIIGIGLGLLGAAWYAEETRRQRRRPAVAAAAAPLPGRAMLLRVGLQLATLVAFVLLYPLTGYVAAAAVLTVGTAWVAGERNWLWIAVVAIVAGPGIRALFAALGTPL